VLRIRTIFVRDAPDTDLAGYPAGLPDIQLTFSAQNLKDFQDMKKDRGNQSFLF
jgi:hypothetical protein